MTTGDFQCPQCGNWASICNCYYSPMRRKKKLQSDWTDFQQDIANRMAKTPHQKELDRAVDNIVGKVDWDQALKALMGEKK